MVSAETSAAAPAELGVPKGLTAEERAAYEQIPLEVDFVRHRSFASPAAEERLFGDEAEDVHVPPWRTYAEASDDIQVDVERPACLSPHEEATLFLRYNYARYRLSRLVAAQRRRKALTRARAMIAWHGRVMELRSDLVRANMALVLAMARRTRIRTVEFTELVGEGNMALLRSVEKFDVARGYKFSTYACRAILKSFSRLAAKAGRYRKHFPTQYDPALDRSDYDVMKDEIHRRDAVETLRELLADNRAKLTGLEQRIVSERFALGSEGKRRTLSGVGRRVGLTNERVRQIQNIALSKLRAAMDEEILVP